MSTNNCRVCSLGIVFFVGALWVGAGRSVAAGGPERLQPIPQQSPSTAQPPVNGQPQASPFQEDSSVGEEDEGAEFCGLPVCSPPGRFWLRADYLMWWTSGTQLPPLVTTGPQGTPVSQAGVLPGSTILYGDRTISDDGRSGFRTTLGMWLDACHVWNLEFDYLSLGERANSFSRSSTGDPILARPFFNVQTNAQASELVAYPGVVEGTVSVDAKDYFQSAGVLVSYNLCSGNSCGDSCGSCGDSCGSCGDSCEAACGPPSLYCCRTDLLVGLRYYNLSDRVGIHESLRQIRPEATFDIHDNFNARNDFYGSEVGLRSQIYRGRWSLEILTKIALGNTHETVTIGGQTVVTAPEQQTQTYGDGVFAGPTNSGTYQRDVFAMIPQLGVELGYQVNCHWRAYVGYNVLYWGCVSRAADQIDLNLDPRNFPPVLPDGLPFPAFAGRTSCFWAQGVNVGTEFRF
jgi:hypothetical protein